MQQVLGYDALKAGLSYLPLSVGIIVAAGVASQLTTKLGFKPVFVTGMLLIGVGLVWFAQISPGGTFVGDVLFPSLLAAVGLGFAFVSITIASVAGVSAQDAGLASGLINTSQQVGGALGLAILAAVSTATIDGRRDPVALTEGFSDAFLVGAGFAFLGAVLALVLLRSEDVPVGEPVPVPV
jgi:MFS family permease